MSYYKVLGMEREPFSTSPDPDFFFKSEAHYAALCRLQVTIALKRGLSVVVGDVGTGKTTVSRKLSVALGADKGVLYRMILNPYFRTEKQFLSRMAALYHVPLSIRQPTSLDYMEAIERFLFQQGVEEHRTVVLLIDEAQILPEFVLELLRILLNYETNDAKILQLVLVGQMELLPRIVAMPNFWDRIALKIMLKPMVEGEVRDMIGHRLREAGYRAARPLFSSGAIARICAHTGGYPRRVNMLCHQALEHLVMFDQQTVDESLIQRVLDKEFAADEFHAMVHPSRVFVPCDGETVAATPLRVVGDEA
jgi:general secretion pathway protein A